MKNIVCLNTYKQLNKIIYMSADEYMDLVGMSKDYEEMISRGLVSEPEYTEWEIVLELEEEGTDDPS